MKIYSSFRNLSALLCAFLLAGAVAQAAEKKEHSLGEKTGEALKKLPDLQNAKDYDGMLQLVESILATVPANSYDAAFLLDIKAKVLLAKDQYGKAVGPWEQALKLSDAADPHYFDDKVANDMVLYLAQIIFSEAASSKDMPPAVQSQQINRALGYLKRHLQNSKKPSPDTQSLYAQLLYQQAVSTPDNINQDLLKQAREVVEQAMLAAIQPKESFYMLLLAIFQQQNEVKKSSELLELVLKKFPAKKDFWPMLAATYLNMAQSDKDPERQRELYIRAINTIERAQSLGMMKTPRDNYNLVTIYITAGQFSKATDLLHAGLKDGSIESTLQNWRVLGSYYQQANKELQAIEALKEAAKLFPKEGMLELQIGEIYRQLEKAKEARDSYRVALTKGNLDKPQVAYQLLAYMSLELDDLDTALWAMTEVQKIAGWDKDPQLKSLKEHVENSVKEREDAKKLKEEQKKK